MAKKMKITYKWQNKNCVPAVNLSGKWLRTIGFEVGGTIHIYTMADTIMISAKR
jgi:Toxin SymE, type I toxin-antitoxin system